MITISSIIGLFGGSIGAFVTKGLNAIFTHKQVKQNNIQILAMSKLDHKNKTDLIKLRMEEQKLGLQKSEVEYSFKESISAHEESNTPLTKHASFWDKANKSIRPLFAYIFMGFFMISKGVALYMCYKMCDVLDVEMLKNVYEIIWDNDTQILFFTIISFHYTSRNFDAAVNYIKDKVRR